MKKCLCFLIFAGTSFPSRERHRSSERCRILCTRRACSTDASSHRCHPCRGRSFPPPHPPSFLPPTRPFVAYRKASFNAHMSTVPHCASYDSSSTNKARLSPPLAPWNRSAMSATSMARTIVCMSLYVFSFAPWRCTWRVYRAHPAYALLGGGPRGKVFVSLFLLDVNPVK